MQQYIKPGAVVVDIGANIGSYTLFLSKIVGEKGQVYAFEPSPKNYSCLVKTASSLKNVSIHQKAVGNFTGKVKLYLSSDLDVDHKTYETDENREHIEVDSIRLDDYFVNQEKIDFVKMDIQGFEYHAFLGMQELMKKNYGIKLIFEFWPFGLNAAGVVPDKLVDLLKQQEFYLYVVGKNKMVQLTDDNVRYGFKEYLNIFASRDGLI